MSSNLVVVALILVALGVIAAKNDPKTKATVCLKEGHRASDVGEILYCPDCSGEVVRTSGRLEYYGSTNARMLVVGRR